MIRELGVEGFKQHKKETFARGHRLHRFWRLFCFLLSSWRQYLAELLGPC